ncbi:MAG: ATP-binding cassette domain-containing protein [Planctomycetes bacterium]|nr:ATP-binding cassette domain-containing protein [Planctomycetota bacterium]
MIEVDSLTKRYAETVAVDAVTFNVGEGEIVGFLGPNGAGKTTTMRMLTCFMPATSGTAAVAGFDIFTHSLEVRQNVGYLPENNPLYPEMRVREYLNFRARIKGVPRKERKARIEDRMQQCGIDDVQRRLIGHLSKGYRQRVGLAEALIHSPKILILDEPTVGLDPNQIRDARQLIKGLGKDHTIMLSTHRLEDVEAICGRVIIIHEGRIVASDTPDNLRQRLAGAFTLKVEVRGPSEQVGKALETIPNVARIQRRDAKDVAEFSIEAKEDIREEIFQCIAKNGWVLRELHREHLRLEEVFAQMTEKEHAPAAAEKAEEKDPEKEEKK